MTVVKTPTAHAAVRLGQLLGRIRRIYDEPRWQGLRTSQFRLLSVVDGDGISVTEVAERMGLTKQAAGQFVGPLTEAGYLRVDVDPADRRAKRVRRTRHGDIVMADLEQRIAAIEREWATVVGAERYATFRAVMDEIVAAGAGGPA